MPPSPISRDYRVNATGTTGHDFAFDQWCANVPELEKSDDGIWSLAATDPTSFSASAHMALAGIEAQSYWFNHRNAVIASAVGHFPPAGPIFDIGGGNGYVSLGLRAAGFDCVVVEPGITGAANAAERGLAVVRAPFQSMTLADESIPSAGMFDVLEHIEDDAAALRSLHRAITPGGRLYIAVPSYRFLWSNEDVRAGHFRRYRSHELGRKLKAAGFTVEYSTYFFAILTAPILLMRALPARFGINLHRAGEQDHTLPGGIAGGLLRRSFEWELRRIKSGGRLSTGTSCLVIARKDEDHNTRRV